MVFQCVFYNLIKQGTLADCVLNVKCIMLIKMNSLASFDECDKTLKLMERGKLFLFPNLAPLKGKDRSSNIQFRKLELGLEKEKRVS